MKNLFFLAFFALLSLNSFAQQQKVDFNKVVVPTDTKAKTFEDFLVQLAWINNPSNQVLEEEVEIAKKEVKIQKIKWTKNLTAQVNYNESHFIQDFVDVPEDENVTLLSTFPRYNLGAKISLGEILNNPRERKQAEHEVKIKELELDQEKLAIRAEVLQRYEKYQVANKILIARKQAEEDAYQTHLLVKELFKKGDADLDEVTRASTSYFNAKEAFINAISEIKISVIKIEEMIGISFEDAKKYGPQDPSKKKK